MIDNILKLIENLSNDDLKMAYKEISSKEDLDDSSKLRKIYGKICIKYKLSCYDFQMNSLKELLLMEITKRTVRFL